MSDIDVKPDTIAKPKIEQPRLYKVILINDDYTPREFVIAVLMAVFHMSEDQAYRVMMTAHQRGACVVAAFTRDIAESKATEGTNAGRQAGHPLEFTTDPKDSGASPRREPRPLHAGNAARFVLLDSAATRARRAQHVALGVLDHDGA